MEKLIQLLNEYAHTYADHYDDTGEEIECKFLYHTDQCFTYEEEGKYDTLVDDVIISKRFGFIKWLVDNDKIEFNNDKMMITYNEEYKLYVVSYEHLLMLLAIQDEPIEFLISILR